ncbi:MAG: glycosyltransferase 87 family protein [Hydrogeniiclostridium mannosilyticum]
MIIWEVVRYMVKGTTSEKVLFSCSVLFSGPMFFLLERGNILIAVFAFSLVFLALYDSEKFSHRLIAYICLAVAAAIKLYPAVLGFLVLYKRYKETVLLLYWGVQYLLHLFCLRWDRVFTKMISGIAVATDVQTGIGLEVIFALAI